MRCCFPVLFPCVCSLLYFNPKNFYNFENVNLFHRAFLPRLWCSKKKERKGWLVCCHEIETTNLGGRKRQTEEEQRGRHFAPLPIFFSSSVPLCAIGARGKRATVDRHPGTEKPKRSDSACTRTGDARSFCRSFESFLFLPSLWVSSAAGASSACLPTTEKKRVGKKKTKECRAAGTIRLVHRAILDACGRRGSRR